ncbi:MAG: LysM peptidoglycan-binding domain-containing protein [Anaerolineales bacterium]
MLKKISIWLVGAALTFGLAACAMTPNQPSQTPITTETLIQALPSATPNGPTPTPLPERTTYYPGELVEYIAQSGDTLDALAVRFNTTADEILKANSFIPDDVSTLPPGMPMQIPIYYRSFWGTTFQIIPDSVFVNGPDVVGFDTTEFASRYVGWINAYREFAGDRNRTGPEIIDLVAENYSISPKLLLALAEYLSSALTSPALPEASAAYPLRFRSARYQGLYQQLIWTANQLNNGYYDWRAGDLIELELPDETLERPDPWQNAASVSLQYVFSQIMPIDQYRLAISPDGLAQTWNRLYGNPWDTLEPHIPGNLTQPGLILPYQAGQIWAYTGGPHTGWGNGSPLAAIDFAPAGDQNGCYLSNAWTTAVADGVVVRSQPGILTLDLDGDGDERTGWVIFYLHIEGREIVPSGTVVTAGEPLGHPSCEGGNATGTHIHIARKYNGEWIVADSMVPFVLEGWQTKAGSVAYLGSLVRFEKTIIACDCGSAETSLQATGNIDGVPTKPLPTATP